MPAINMTFIVFVVCFSFLLFILSVLSQNNNFIGTREDNAAWTCSDVLNYYLHYVDNVNSRFNIPASGTYYLKSRLTSTPTYQTLCKFDTSTKTAWTLILKEGGTQSTTDTTLDSTWWNRPSGYTYNSTWTNLKVSSISEIPFKKLKIIFNASPSRELDLGLRAYSQIVNSDWKIYSIHHVINKQIVTSNGVTKVNNLNLIAATSWGSWWNLHQDSTTSNEGCEGYGFEIIPPTLPKKISSSPFGVSIGYYANSKSDCTGEDYRMVGMGFGNNKFSPAFRSGFISINTQLSVDSQLYVSEGQSDCSSLNYCNLNGRCIDNNVCDCLPDWSGDKSCSTRTYSGQDLLVYLPGDDYKSKTNTYHALVEENLSFSGWQYNFFSTSSNGLEYPHLTLGAYSSTFKFPSDDFSIVCQIQVSPTAPSGIYYILSYNNYTYVNDNTYAATSTVKMFLQKGTSEIITVQINGVSDSKSFSSGKLFKSSFIWITFTRAKSQSGNTYDSQICINTECYSLSGLQTSTPVRSGGGLLTIGATPNTANQNYLTFNNIFSSSLNGLMKSFLVFNRALNNNEIGTFTQWSQFFCFGVLSSASNVCNGFKCNDYNICGCPSTFTGQNCEGFPSNSVTFAKAEQTYAVGLVRTNIRLELKYGQILLPVGSSYDRDLFKCKAIPSSGSPSYFDVTYSSGSTTFNCDINLPNTFAGRVILVHSFTDTSLTNNGGVMVYILSRMTISLSTNYWVPNQQILLTVTSGEVIPFSGSGAPSISVSFDGKLFSTTTSDNNNFAATITNPLTGSGSLSPKTCNVQLCADTVCFSSVSTFKITGQGNINMVNYPPNALIADSPISVSFRLGSNPSFIPAELSGAVYCNFGGLNIATTKSGDIYSCSITSTIPGFFPLTMTVNYNSLSFYTVSVNQYVYYVYKKDGIVTTSNQRGYFYSQTNPINGFGISLSSYSINVYSGYDLNRIKCLFQNNLSGSYSTANNIVTGVNCGGLSINNEQIYYVTFAHDNELHNLQPAPYIPLYSFKTHTFNPSTIVKVLNSQTALVDLETADGSLLDISQDNDVYYQTILLGSPNLNLQTVPIASNGVVLKLRITIPILSNPGNYNLEIRFYQNSNTAYNLKLNSNAITLSVVSPQSISFFSTSSMVVNIGANPTITLTSSPGIPADLVSRVFCKYNETYYFPVTVVGTATSCQLTSSVIGSDPGYYSLSLAIALSGGNYDTLSNTLNVYSIGLYNIISMTPSIFPVNTDFISKIDFSNPPSAFFVGDSAVKYYFKSSTTSTLIGTTISTNNGIVSLKSNGLMPNNQNYVLAVQYEGIEILSNPITINFISDVYTISLDSSTDVAVPISTPISLGLTVTSLPQYSVPFIYCAIGSQILPTIFSNHFTCSSVSFSKNGMQNVRLVYNDGLNSNFNITNSLDYPVISTVGVTFNTGTANVQYISQTLSTIVTCKTWIPSYLTGNVKCQTRGETNYMTGTNYLGGQTYECISISTSQKSASNELVLVVNVGKTITFSSNAFATYYMPPQPASSYLYIDTGISILPSSISPTLQLDTRVIQNLDYNCALKYDTLTITTVPGTYDKDNKTISCDPIILDANNSTGKYQIQIIAQSKQISSCQLDLFNGAYPTTENSYIYYISPRALALNSVSPISFLINTNSIITFDKWTDIPQTNLYFKVDGSFTPVTYSTYGMTFTLPTLNSVGYRNVDLWYKSPYSTYSVQLTSSPFLFPFITSNSASFKQSAGYSNGGLLNIPFSTRITFNGFLGKNSSLYSSSLHSRVYCQIGTEPYSPTTYHYYNEYSSDFDCTLQYGQREGLIDVNLYLKNTDNDYILLTNTPLKAIIAKQLKISNVSPFTVMTDQTPFTATLSTDATISDTIFSSSVQYYCAYTTSNGQVSQKFTANRVSGTSTFTCNILSSPSERNAVKVKLILTTIATLSDIVYSDEITFFFQQKVQLVSLKPFAKVLNFGNTFSTNVAIGTNVSLFTDNELYCSFISGSEVLRYSKASFTANTNTVSCLINKYSFGGGKIDYINIALYQNATGGINFIFSDTIQYVLLDSPIRISSPPAFFQKSNIGSFYSLNIPNPTTSSLLSVNVTMSYTQKSGGIMEIPFVCDTISASSPRFSFNVIEPLIVTPQPITFTLKLGRIGQNDLIESHTLNGQYFYLSTVNIDYTVPFINDFSSFTSSQSKVSYYLTSNSPSLSNGYSFSCIIGGNSKPAEIYGNYFVCPLYSPAYDYSTVNVDLKFNDTDLQQIISSNREAVEFSSLRFINEFAKKDDLTYHTLYYDNLTSFVVPTKYRTGNFKLKLNDTISYSTFNTYSCTPNILNGNLNCTKGIVYPDISYLTMYTKGIQLASPYLTYNDNFLTKIHTPLVLYIPSIVTTYPRASLRGSSITLELSFSNITLDISVSPYTYNLYCLFDGLYYSSASVIDTKKMKCDIALSSQESKLQVLPLISIPSLTNTNASLNSNNVYFYILDLSLVEYLNHGINDEPVMTNILSKTVTLKLRTNIPIEIISSGLISCRLFATTKAGTSEWIAGIDTQFWKHDTNTTFFNCTIPPGDNYIGTGNLSLWYSEKDISFQITSNSLSLFIVGVYSISTSPMVSTTNRTATTTITSDLETVQAKVNYGVDVYYFIRYYNSSTPMIYSDTNITFSSTLTLQLFSENPGSFIISIYMHINGLNILSTQEATFTFLDGFFLEPNYAFITGGYTTLQGYTYDSADAQKVMRFKEYNYITFSCTPNYLNILNCSLPSLKSYGLPTFYPYIVEYGVKEVATQFILYDNIPVTLEAVIFPITFSSVQFSLVSSSNYTNVHTASYFTMVVRKDDNDPYPDVYTISGGILPPKTQFNVRTKSTEGMYTSQLFYYNSMLLSQNARIPVNSKENIYFLDRKTVNFLDSPNLFYIEKDKTNNQTINFSIVNGNAIPSNLIPYIHCMLNNTISIPTTYDSTKSIYSCNINSAISATYTLNIWLIKSNVFQGGFQISRNGIMVTLLEKLTLQSVRPYAIVQSFSSTVKLILTPMQTNSIQSFFSGKDVSLFCYVASGLEGSLYFPFYKPISLTEGYSLCPISKTTSNYVMVKLVAFNTSVVTSSKDVIYGFNVLDVTNSIQVNFYDAYNLVRSTPILEGIDKNHFTNQNKYISNQTIYFTGSNILRENLYCLYYINNIAIRTALATFTSSHQLLCDIDIKQEDILVDQANVVDISLYYILTNDIDVIGSFTGSLNNISITILSTPLAFKVNSTIDDIQTHSGLLREYLQTSISSNIFISNRKLPINYYVDFDTTDMVFNCDYKSGNPVSCSFSNPKFSTLPHYINSSLRVTDTLSNVTLPIDTILYYERMDFVSMYPFILSFREGIPKKIYFTVNKVLDMAFNYFIEVIGTTKTTTYPIKVEGGGVFSFEINPNPIAEMVNVSLGYYYKDVKVRVSNAPAILQFIDKLFLVDSKNIPYSLPRSGGSLVSASIPTTSPTILSTITSYAYDLKLYVKGRYISLSNSGCSILSYGNINCLTSSFDSSIFSSLPADFNVDLFINSVRSFTFFRKLTLYNSISSVSIDDNYVSIGTQKVITMQSDQFIFSTVQNATIYYNCSSPSCNSSLTQTNIEISSCILTELFTLKCPVPNFVWDTSISKYADVTLSLTLNGKDILNLSNQLKLFIKNDISLQALSETEFNKEVSKQIFIYGSMFYQSSIYVMFYDYSITKLETATFINSTTIKTNTPLLYNTNINFPRKLKVAISLDGKNFIYNQKLEITCKDILFNNVVIESPRYTPISTNTKITITGFNMNSVTLANGEQLALELFELSNPLNFIALTCAQSGERVLSCNAITPTYSTTLSLRAFIQSGLEKKPFYINARESITVFNNPICTGIYPTYIMKTSQRPITLSGSFPIVPLSNIKLLASFTSMKRSIKKVMQTIDATNILPVSNLQSDALALTISSPDSLANIISLQASFDNGTTFTMLANQLEFVDDFNLVSLRNELTGDTRGIFTFTSTPTSIVATNIPTYIPQSEWRMRIKNNFYEKVFNVTEISNFMLDTTDPSTTTIKLNLPDFTSFLNGSSLSIDFSFPLETRVGFSFNGGFDYKDIITKYLDRYREEIVTNVIPSILPRIPYLLRVEGIYLESVVGCKFDSPDFSENEEPIVVDLKSNSTSVIYCILPDMPSTINYVHLYLVNDKNETTKNPKVLTYYTNPTMTDFYPKIAPTHALLQTYEGYSRINTTVTVINLRTDLTLYPKYGGIYNQDTFCTVKFISDAGASLDCPMIAHESQVVQFCISYNKIDWYSVNGLPCNSKESLAYNATMTYYSCAEGYTASTYKDYCTPCPTGTYKPSKGIYACAKCERNTYNPYLNATNCIDCPRFSVSEQGIDVVEKCLCTPGYYHNPNLMQDILFLDPLDYYCLPCPDGAICNSTGTYKPVALNGYWFSNQSTYTEFQFFECFPKDSCAGGGGYENCTSGYTGINCGVCARGYYRWQNKCQECEGYAWLKILLLLALIGIISIGLLAFSSIRISHLASISIAFSYTQVVALFTQFDIKWPGSIGGMITASSITNFNISFVSPECWIPDISYFARWLVTSLLPFYFFIAFGLLYLIGIARSFFASKFGHKVPFRYWGSYEDEEEQANYDEEFEKQRFEYMSRKQKIKYTITSYLKKLGRAIVNFLIWLRNFSVWFLKQKQTKEELRIFLNMIINSYTAFLSFCFTFIMSNASQTFVCNKQSTGDYTLQASPDILCFANDSRWLTMLPISICFYVIFGLGGLLFFIAIYIMKKRFAYKINKLNRDEEGNTIVDLKSCKTTTEKIRKEKFLLERDLKLKIEYKNFYQRLKFILKRFMRKYFYWEAVITLRKLLISILHIFLKPLLVVVFAIFVIFIAMILHSWILPFKHKFHNVMEYFVLMATLIVLFFGLLFFVKTWPAEWMETAAMYIAVIIIVLSLIFVAIMVIHDVFTRVKSDRAKKRKRRQELISKFGEEQAKKHMKEYESLFAKSTKTIIEDLDEGNEDDPWIIVENEYAKIIQEEMMQFGEEDWYYDGKVIDINLIPEEDRWFVYENGLRKAIVKFEEKDDWVVHQNPLNEQNQFDYQQLEMKIYHVQFNLPFFQDDENESTDEEAAVSGLNDLLDNIFSKERIARKKQSVKKSFKDTVSKIKLTLQKKKQSEEEVKEEKQFITNGEAQGIGKDNEIVLDEQIEIVEE